MGCQESKTEQQKDEIRRNKEVEKALKQDKGAFMSEIKLLLLGNNKSTLYSRHLSVSSAEVSIDFFWKFVQYTYS